MPHQCVKCGKFYDDGSDILLKGCPCGGKMFFYVKKSRKDLVEKAEQVVNLSSKEKEQIENDVYELIGDSIDKNKPVILDLESINITKQGKYKIDLLKLFKKGEPLIYKLEDGKYVIDLVESFKKLL